MIYAIQGPDIAKFPHVIDDVFRLRARVFSDRLGWQVQVKDGKEIDIFDDLDPLYLVSVDCDNRVLGTQRLLPTTGPNMLRDVFNCLMDEGHVVESPLIWESSRFAVDLELSSSFSRGTNPVVTELLLGVIEIGLEAGLSHIQGVIDAHMLRVLRRAGYGPEIVGRPRQIGRVMTYAGLFEVSERSWKRIAEIGGRSGRVLGRIADLSDWPPQFPTGKVSAAHHSR